MVDYKMYSFSEPFNDSCANDTTTADICVSKQHDKVYRVFQHITFGLSITLVVSIGLLSLLTYFSLENISPTSRLDSLGIEQLSNSVDFIVSTNILPTYSAVIMLVKYICVEICFCTVVLLYLLFTHWMCMLPSWSVFYNLDMAIVVAFEYFGISIHLSIITSPQINNIVSFPQTLVFMAISMATAILFFIIVSLFSDTMHK